MVLLCQSRVSLAQLGGQKSSECVPARADAHDHGGVTVAGVNTCQHYSPLQAHDWPLTEAAVIQLSCLISAQSEEASQLHIVVQMHSKVSCQMSWCLAPLKWLLCGTHTRFHNCTETAVHLCMMGQAQSGNSSRADPCDVKYCMTWKLCCAHVESKPRHAMGPGLLLDAETPVMVQNVPLGTERSMEEGWVQLLFDLALSTWAPAPALGSTTVSVSLYCFRRLRSSSRLCSS